MNKLDKIQKLVSGERPNYIEVFHDGELIGTVENDSPVKVQTDTREAGETLIKLRALK